VIFRGRLIALVLFGAYSWAFNFSRTAGLLTVALLCVTGPWLFMRAQQFSLGNTSYRGLRFGFHGRVSEAYVTVLPVLLLWLVPTVAAAFVIGENWSIASSMLAIPWMHHRLKAYQLCNATYGDRNFAFTSATLRFYGVYVKGLGFLLLGLLLFLATLMAWSFASQGGAVLDPHVGLQALIYGGFVILLMYLIVWPYYAARLQVVWSRIQLDGIQFRTEIRARSLFRLVFKNVMLTLLTWGLYWPWAAIALARYRIECVRVLSNTPLSTVAAGVQAHPVSAVGAGATDAFGIDIGL
jgi:uncharacterized membrane protein YjgN (DUF898 family)